jgi:hypothetical protein
MKRILCCILLVACGGGQQPAPPPAPSHEMTLPPELAKFHDVLAPRWHADKGAKRMADTCAAIADFTRGADTLAATPPPAGASPEWTTGGQGLVTAVAGMKTTCDGNDAITFELAFEEVHKSFHVMLEAIGAK